LISVTIKAENVPKTITEPASLNIFPPTPKTKPSLLCSIEAEATVFAKPVTGTAVPAPAHWAIRSYTPSPDNKASYNFYIPL